MVQTRNSSKKGSSKENETPKMASRTRRSRSTVRVDETDNPNDDEFDASNNTISERKSQQDQNENDTISNADEQPSKQSTIKKKNRRQQQKEQLKSKNKGLGLQISVESTSSKRIVFDETNLPSPTLHDDNEEEEREKDNVDNVDNNNGDEKGFVTYPSEQSDDRNENEDDNVVDHDDAVEEVQGQVAREDILDQIHTEEKVASQSKSKKKKKERKSKTPSSTQKEDDDDDDLDDDFFSQLETVRQQEAEEERRQEEKTKKASMKGKHTTFVFSQDDSNNTEVSSKKVNENIEVVVLQNNIGDSSNSFTTASNKLSQEALLYSRNHLIDGSDSNMAGAIDVVSNNYNHKKKRGRSAGGNESSIPWKRSRKIVALTQARGNRRMKSGTGKPSVFFSRAKTR